MLLNNKVLLTAVVVFMTSGCVNNKSMEQQTQIINLQGELVAAQKYHLQTQEELKAKAEALSASHTEIKSLSALLAESVESVASVESGPDFSNWISVINCSPAQM